MERYRYFTDTSYCQEYFRSLGSQKIGEGSEGQAFLLSNKQVVKIFNGPSKPDVKEEDKEKIIMAQDYNVRTFMLPVQLLICNGKIIGYIAKYFPNNIIKFKAPYNGNIDEINISRLLKAREFLLIDVDKLSQDQVKLNDVDFNLMFDNKRIGIIDTFSYCKDFSASLENNIDLVDKAILRELHYHDINFRPDYSESLEQNLRRIRY